MGRHKEFDPDAALEAAMTVFWRQGYEGSSVADLTAAMGVSLTSLYAAFGNKEDLFRQALDRYDSHYVFVAAALKAPTAKQVVAELLSGFADAMAGDPMPPGCLIINAALACSEDVLPIQHIARARRLSLESRMRERLKSARASKDLPPDEDPTDLARYVLAVVYGMAVQAVTGAGRADLHRIGDMTLRAWPSP